MQFSSARSRTCNSVGRRVDAKKLVLLARQAGPLHHHHWQKK